MENPGVTLERDACKRMMSRAEQQGALVQKAKAARDLLGDGSAILGPETTGRIGEMITVLASKDKRLRDFVESMTGTMKKQSIWRRLINSVLKIIIGVVSTKLKDKIGRGSFLQHPDNRDDDTTPPQPPQLFC